MKSEKEHSTCNLSYTAFFILFFCSFSSFILHEYFIPNNLLNLEEATTYKESYCNITNYNVIQRTYPYIVNCADCTYTQYLPEFDVQYTIIENGKTGSATGFITYPVAWYTSLQSLNDTLDNYKIGNNVSCYIDINSFNDIAYFAYDFYDIISTIIILYTIFYMLIFCLFLSILFFIISCVISYKSNSNKINIDKSLYDNL